MLASHQERFGAPCLSAVVFSCPPVLCYQPGRVKDFKCSIHAAKPHLSPIYEDEPGCHPGPRSLLPASLGREEGGKWEAIARKVGYNYPESGRHDLHLAKSEESTQKPIAPPGLPNDQKLEPHQTPATTEAPLAGNSEENKQPTATDPTRYRSTARAN
ncbi:hypothetical protein BBK36DRAFT_1201055 [Trichoderma citrinoviride]|uniref:Uncharacterized protein n=1 Tax=Trichoderma citrinoviride TaxID=58853 RepID=A0A2T4BAR5_9HYPO|nr:hypothetical protein BBK36DRAFT_1201055 [Trichoderma citrinoviride]PTB66415.1 hypothetical protein BBK36DRAFT_1201055 [Trichoderma citrinoviride]